MLTLTFALLLVSPCLGDIMDTLTANKASTLTQLINKVGLDATLKSGTYTVFAPTDAAFAKLPDSTLTGLLTNNLALEYTLKDHVVAGSVLSNQIQNELKVPSVNGDKIRFNVYSNNGVVTANGVKISTADVSASNGVIHFLDGVIMPADKTIVQVVSEDPELSTLLTAMTAAHIANEFQVDNFTLFAPTNDAFNALPKEELNALLANPDKLKETLEYHGIHQTLYSAGLYNREIENTIDTNNDRIRIGVSSTGGVTVQQARVTKADIVAKNGVIHKVDRVIIPRSVQQWIVSTGLGK